MTWQVRKLSRLISLDKLRDYFDHINENFSHLKWIAKDNIDKVSQGVGGHKIDGVYGYALQSNLDDLTIPAPPYNIGKTSNVYRDTQLVFGIIEDLKTLFPDSHQYSIAAHSPGTVINTHIDSDTYLKIHIPIYTNPDAVFYFDDSKYNLPADGSAYLINTAIPHGTVNNGNTERVHLFFKIKISDFEKYFLISQNFKPY